MVNAISSATIPNFAQNTNTALNSIKNKRIIYGNGPVFIGPSPDLKQPIEYSNMIKFNTINLTEDKLDGWIKNNLNVCLIGKHGCGKSTCIIEAFERNNLRWKYFSGATLDPWVDVVGVPTVSDKNADGKKILDFILPAGMDENLEAIFCDEYNRTHKTVRNALLELVQFKSINGRKFPKLKIIWAAVNPGEKDGEDSNEYDVEQIDYAQLDRFHIIAELNALPDRGYFKSKHGQLGDIIIDWYKNQPKEVLNFISSRRLDYVLDCYKNGTNIKDMLPIQCNIADLVKKLSEDEETRTFNHLLGKKKYEDFGKFLSDKNMWDRFKPIIVNRKLFMEVNFVNKELLSSFVIENTDYRKYVFGNKEQTTKNLYVYTNTIHKDLFADLNKTYNPDVFETRIGNLQNSLNLSHLGINDVKNNFRFKALADSVDNSSVYTSNTHDKKQLFSTFVSSLRDFHNGNAPITYLSKYLAQLNSCHEPTVLGLPKISEFLSISLRILQTKGVNTDVLYNFRKWKNENKLTIDSDINI